MGTVDSISLAQRKSETNERGFIWVRQRFKNKHNSIPKRRNRTRNLRINSRYTKR